MEKKEFLNKKFIQQDINIFDIMRNYIPKENTNLFLKENDVFLKINSKDKFEFILSTKKEVEDFFKLLTYYLDRDNKEYKLIKKLKERNEKISTAESITGGLIASSIINISGASEVIEESYVTYSDGIKEKILNVSHETISKYSAVSKNTCSEMLDGLFKLTNSNLCISTTGYAHIGKSYIGILYNGKKNIYFENLSGSRNEVRFKIKEKALDYALLMMKGKP
ncbi:MAG: CinA family protein [Peptoniphilaceae bacterium]|nr:CinA family protein [Peptoniphilaceae bacterium]MDY3738540.1 CinA family protein [Peptoniphilaceae bacterium]